MKSSASQLLPKKQSEIYDLWITQQMKDDGLREDLMSSDEMKQESNAFLTALLNAVRKDNFSDISLPATFVFSLKDAIIKILEKEIKDVNLLYPEILKINRLLDSLGLVTLETFIKGREEVILRQTSEISEISTPVIQVWAGILALPIIGTLDSARTQIVMESLLLKIVETESTIAILDISGVPAVDSLVAQHLIKTVAATRLMGAECIISGIRPEIAQTIVHLGIDLSNINTKASLAHALRTDLALT